MSQILFTILFVILSLVASDNSFAQTSDAAQKTQGLVASLDKTKYKKKEKKNVVVEVYVKITNEAVVKDNPADYAGSYVSEDGEYRLDLSVSNGRAEGSGTDMYFENSDFSKQRRRSFTLRDAQIEGALLTATKVYENGQTQKFEAVFVNRTSLAGKNPNEIEVRDTKYGIGFVESNDMMTNRVFLEFKR